MSKKARVTCCQDCPYMDNEYYDYMGECSFLTTPEGKYRNLSLEISIYSEIHPECPLEEWEENE